jgi:hypothetical protein
MPGVFISYVRENSDDVERLAQALRAYDINVWLDKNQIEPGQRWKEAIRRAISQGDFFIACFSVEYNSRSKTYMNEELTLAIEELRQRPSDRAWFIPVLLSKTDIPDRSIGAGETLRSIQWEPLYENWDQGIKRILSVIQPASKGAPQIDVLRLTDDDWHLLLHRIKQGKCTPVIGPGACYGVLPFEFEMAREWTLKYDYQTDDSKDLEEVAQFLSLKFDPIFPKKLIQERFGNAKSPDFTDPNEPHTVLAALPLTVYITTNYDDYMVRALKAQDKDPQRKLCRWNEQIRDLPSLFDDPGFEPTVGTPIVFHLYGHTEVPESMVLTADDYPNFLASISKNEDLLPVRIQKALVSTFPLFFGYSMSDNKFRTLFRAVATYLTLNPHQPLLLRRLPSNSQSHGQRAKTREYLENFYADKYSPGRTSGYQPGLLKEFAAELRKRWEEFSHGS